MSGRTVLSRRRFLGGAGASCASLVTPSLLKGAGAPYIRNTALKKRVIVLGMDGLAPQLVSRFVAEGVMPHFKRFMEQHFHAPLTTTMPAQSPVAWSSFASGCNPGKHGIFDFIHRDPSTVTPRLSISRAKDAARHLEVGSWRLPLGGGSVELMRRGPALWSVLEQHGVSSSVFQIPSNFPVLDEGAQSVSGMGTPDLLGGYGTCSYFSDSDLPGASAMSGIHFKRVRFIDHLVKAAIKGPANSLRAGSPEVEVPIEIRRDPTDAVVSIKVQHTELVVKAGEWSEWVPLSFELLPLFASVPGMVRFYVKEVYPKFKLYVTPVNIDPMDPAMPICSPAGYSKELAGVVGRFYTQGLPADTKSLANGILSDEEYLSQALLVLEENERMLEYQLKNFSDGFLFFYFSSIDQNSHMLMRAMDPTHPLYDPNAAPAVQHAIKNLYQRMDEAFAKALAHVDQHTTIMVLSDHGFDTFRREIHLNTWLMQEGYLVLKEPLGDDPGDVFSLVDWSRTQLYGLGFNGMYLNLRGREPQGIVEPERASPLLDEVSQKLLAFRDPKNGARVISQMFRSDRIYHGDFVGLAPDLLVGYEKGYRVSDESVLGKFPQGVVGDRTDKWSSDHCFDYSLVPGVFLTNAACQVAQPAIWDLAPTVLKLFGIDTPPEMDGKSVLA